MEVAMTQHPVGQGGMQSGYLQGNNSTLHWVYDCGSNQRDRLKAEIKNVSARGPIDLLFLSHLDSDHVNGIDHLLVANTVTEVVLPYMTTIDFAAAIVRDMTTDSLTGTFLDFVSDPVKWLTTRGVALITFVKAMDDNSPLEEWLAPDREGQDPTNEEPQLKVSWSPPPGHVRNVRGATVRTIAPGATAGLSGANRMVDWLFVPYAHKPASKHMQEFRQCLQLRFGVTLTRARIVQLVRDENSREALRNCYLTFWADHNKVSMSLYAGPARTPSHSHKDLPFNYWVNGATRVANSALGWLMTGDADLATRCRYRGLMHYYGPLKGQVSTLVLPHHGAERSFHPALVHELPNLETCIAAAGPNQYGHPHPDVRACVIERLGEDRWQHVSDHPGSGFGVRARF
ncbi:ComEC/Rec2 family competence protein [Pseudomonas soli]|uniref:hypothetical protein n=1 Tax=Pseudomonas soli TaxID=1306993 RepID=UPI00381A454A